MLPTTGIPDLLSVAEPGKVVMVAGRPAAGVSTTLATAVAHWASSGKPAVMASWERPGGPLRGLFPAEGVEVLDILGWTAEEFERALHASGVPAGTLVAVDYLQLIGGSDDTGARLARIARETDAAILLGAMAPRAVQPLLESGAPGALALRAFARAIGSVRGADAHHVYRLAAIRNGRGRRQLVISQPAPNLRLVHATAFLS
ncbi:MAG TPA: hypothetical protein VM287_08175 [Egibacteraceae bacterium]|nr:hypothetical protein [Egibacteraceae bacterium]